MLRRSDVKVKYLISIFSVLAFFYISEAQEFVVKLKGSNTLLKVTQNELTKLKNTDIQFIEINHKVKKLQEIVPNDEKYSQQYALKKLNFEKLWDRCRDSSNIVVAVIDSGINYKHEDLQDNIWKNPREICDNKLDDDENGFVDDCYGWNFVSNDNNVFDDDSDSHGTMLSGIVGAVTDNGKGIAGAAWKVKIMAIKILDRDGSGDIYSLYKAIKYAVDNGAKIINLSLGYPSGCYSVEPSNALKEAIGYANERGVLVVAAAGNYGCNNDIYPLYPASLDLPNIISVGSVSKDEKLSWFSHFGVKSVHLLSYGEDILSTSRNNDYKSLSGTSFSAPFVTGVAALLMACQNNLSHIQIKEKIVSSVRQVESLQSLVMSGGILDAYSAYTSEVKPIRPTGLTVSSDGSSIVLSWKDNSNLESGYKVERSQDGVSWQTIATLSLNSITYKDSQVQSGKTYYYRVYAYMGNTTSSYSNSVAFQIFLPYSQNTSSSSGGGGGCNLSKGYQLSYLLVFLLLLAFRRLKTVW
ncbi:MAG: S8 family serine peptidase [Hydrogenothermaceae bacterium]|nr:S8 family serine peptidase [Hydrogenothermaceae bacterium]